jgi:hypothetical protein
MSVNFPPNFQKRINEATATCDVILKTMETIPIKDRQIALFRMIRDLEKTCRQLAGCFDTFVQANSPQSSSVSARIVSRPI